MDYGNETATKLCRRVWTNGTIHKVRLAFDIAVAVDRRTVDIYFDCAASQTDQ